ncbi:hypothetical protein D3C71_2190390 [compost metagenome]
MLNVLTELNERGQSIIMVTHDLKTALRGNRILYLRDGIMVGELQMPPFSGTNGPERQEQLQTFLADLGW